jgi:nucleoside diphosphate kinase
MPVVVEKGQLGQQAGSSQSDSAHRGNIRGDYAQKVYANKTIEHCKAYVVLLVKVLMLAMHH